MSERERWIVYPLLFLALGASLRDKLVDRTTTKSIVCQELMVVDEQPIGREPVLLARIGRPEPTESNNQSGGYLMLNGQLDVVDRDPIANQTVRRLITLGRTEPAAGAPSSGYAVVNGQVMVDGAINARQYAYNGVPFVPALPAGLGIPLPDFLRAMQEAQRRQGNTVPNGNAPDTRSSEQPPPAEPLADPPANR